MCTRLTCSQCGAVYNESFHTVTTATPCPTCRGELYRRADDTFEALDERMAQYRVHTVPVVKYYEEKGLLKHVDARPNREAMFRGLYEEIGGDTATTAPDFAILEAAL